MTRLIVLCLLAFALTGCGFEIVDTGHRGVQTTYGKVHPESLGEGLHWYNPITDNITEMDVRVLKWEFKTPVYTKDIQKADLDVTVNYRLEPAAAPAVLAEVGTEWADKLVGQDVFDGIKSIAGKYEAAELISNRGRAITEMYDEVRKVLAPKHVQVTGLAVTNIDFDDGYENSVERKVVAAQDALAAANKTSEVVQEGEQNKARAKADAEAMADRARAIRENQGLIEWERLQVQRAAIQKWNGTVPSWSGGNGAIPFISVEPPK